MASHLGISVAFLESSMSSSELEAWVQYYKIEPFLADRVEVALANLTAIIAGIFSSKELDYKDFMLTGKKEIHKEKNLRKDILQCFGI